MEDSEKVASLEKRLKRRKDRDSADLATKVPLVNKRHKQEGEASPAGPSGGVVSGGLALPPIDTQDPIAGRGTSAGEPEAPLASLTPDEIALVVDHLLTAYADQSGEDAGAMSAADKLVPQDEGTNEARRLWRTQMEELVASRLAKNLGGSEGAVEEAHTELREMVESLKRELKQAHKATEFQRREAEYQRSKYELEAKYSQDLREHYEAACAEIEELKAALSGATR